MAKLIKLENAEVITFKNSDQVLSEWSKEGSDGTLCTFKTRTRLNDTSDRSPFSFDTCKRWVNSVEELNNLRAQIKAGTVVTVEGPMSRSAGKPKNEGDKVPYYENIDVKVMTVVSSPDSQEEQLPF